MVESRLLQELLTEVRRDPEFLGYLDDRFPGLSDELSVELERLRLGSAADPWRAGLARPSQLLPGTKGSFSDRTDWRVWLLCGGRGSGKSRAGAEAVRELLLESEWLEPPRCALVSTTLDAVRIDMVEGQLFQVLGGMVSEGGRIAQFNRSSVELWLDNGAYLKGYSSERPSRLRGPNFHLAWADEPAAWLDAHKAPSEDSTWSNLEFATRLDDSGRWSPRIIATTTPKPVRLLRVRSEEDEHYPGVFDDPDTVISSMRTMDNIHNLADTFRKRVIGRYDGTRLGAQELEGKLLDVSEHALWTPEQCSKMRIPLHRILEPYSRGTTVVAVDPSVGDGSGDECGIVVAARRLGDMGYNADEVVVLDDASMRGRPAEWAQRVAEKVEEWNADYVVAETNQGGQLVREVLGRHSRNLPVRDVFAKRGKSLRAEPVALLSDQGQVKLAGSFPQLEDQMCVFEPDSGSSSPDRLDAFVYATLFLMPARQVTLDLVSSRSAGTVRFRR